MPLDTTQIKESKALILNFTETETEKKRTVRVPQFAENATKEEIIAAMDAIITYELFEGWVYPIQGEKASVITTTTSELDVTAS
jgi:hypothetical protein